jgi:LTXXQ motif family protein
MSLRKKRLGAVLLASALAFAVTTDAQARGGGGGGHFGGGGGFGGGGMRMGGFGGGAMRMGGFGGGGMHFNSGSFRPGAGGFTARSFGGRSYSGISHGLGAQHFSGSVGRSIAGRNLGRAAVGAGALGAGHFVNHAFAHNNWGHNPFHGSFPHPYPGFRGWYGYGWYGPVFWPFAYDILFADLFWPWAYDYPFWAYGYPDIYGGLFWPYGYDDLAGYLPPGPGPVVYGGGGSPAVRGAYARGTRAESRQAEVTGQINQSCGEDSKEVAGWPIDRIEQVVTPTADQRTLLDDLSNASTRAAQTIKEACPTSVAFAPTGRLDAMQKRIAGMVQAVDIVTPPLDKFYDSLTDEQKARLNAAGDQNGKNRSLANCGAVTSATQWPGERIEKAVQPNEQQQAKLDALKTAMANAADQLSKSCPSSLPATPPARLGAISMRLNTMLDSVKSVRGALDDFYSSLSDEQKAQFNLIGRQQTAQKQS